ncbi:assimilatory sulfite reductase (NADPH) flavoprotein subunit [Sporosarcina sp. YIM B06819]|uniref:assimilatory sulfite reductase (NADPH) flavoprotein subunit n=1 Tax=Sporosarcina sp. YIM B06819 TaxID=3081769 RepID=UPI00298CF7FF|nr:assimilatory sulfite reductase (NADPH) flavoprotein subunit [Sporosarcina sp. YIM B06819]
MTLQVMNSPFNEQQVALLNQLLPALTETQQIWLGGYLSARQIEKTPSESSSTAVLEAQEIVEKVITKEVTILFGSQTGNAQALAGKLTKNLQAKNFNVTLTSMNDFKVNTLKKIDNLLLIVSTHGEGDPPDTALPFYEFLLGKRAPRLENLQYSVLALGDSSYEYFCHTGKEFDERLLELGAKQLSPRVDCDLDFDEPAEEWFATVLVALNHLQGSHSAVDQQAVTGEDASAEAEYSRTNPFKAEILENLNLNGRGSNKETRHIELSLEGSNLQFEPGDSLGVYPQNDPELVDALIAELSWNGDDPVAVNKQGTFRPLREALLSTVEITVLTKPLLQKLAELTANPALKELVVAGKERELKDYMYGRDLLDVVRDFAPWQVPACEFIAILRKIPARLYSIASSQKANPDEVHLTVGTLRYEAHDRQRLGVCSGELALRAQPGDHLSVYVQSNQNFRLPANPNTPIIMIGPGTGIAPFRAFLEEREEIGAEGKTWLFFGDQHYTTDFLYQTEWQRFAKEGILTQIDVAFSRDTADKVYVQHRMLEKSQELFEWLEEGAVLYVCGDEKHMAADVHDTLETILQDEGGLNAKEAADYLAEMQQQKRYQRDVY